MKKIIIFIILLIAFFVTGYFKNEAIPEWKKISPFTAVSFEGETIFAEFEGSVYELVSIEGVSSDELVKAAKKRFGRQWQKRIREDIAEVLIAAGAPEGLYVDLALKDLKSGEVNLVSDAEMTYEKRRKAKSAS